MRFGSHLVLLSIATDALRISPAIRPRKSSAVAPRRSAVVVAPPVEQTTRAKYSPFLEKHLLLPDFQAPEYTSSEVAAMVASASARGGLKGLGIPAPEKEWPSKAEVLSAIPKHCFERSTAKSMACAAVSLTLTLACGAAGAAFLPSLKVGGLVAAPIWAIYAAVTGTAAMGCWVLAHECGHGAFSSNKALQFAVGFAFHSSLLVPYLSWQRSHAVHHLNTNHVTEGETHVPPVVGTPDAAGALNAAKSLGRFKYAVASVFSHLVLGWPGYLLKGASGGPKYGATSHFWPWGHSGAQLSGGKELFPTSKYKRGVLVSSAGVGAVLGGLALWARKVGVAKVGLLYGAPLVVVNAWLVLYTWLQHTDVDVAHFDEAEHTWVKGALQTIDRPYGGLINLLHHGIGSTHVLHHVCSAVPHYNAWEATDALKQKFPQCYLHDPTPIHQALWRVARDCIAVEKLPGAGGSYLYTAPLAAA